MTEEEIKKKWFPICQPGNLVMRTEPDSEISFFLVCGLPHYHQGLIDNVRGIELVGLWISDPITLFQGKILKVRSHQPPRLKTSRLGCPETG